MWSRKILVAYDGSEPSRKALDIVREIAGSDPSIKVVLVHVMRLFSSGAAAAGIDTVIMDEPDAREEECDLIIMGSRGKGGVKGYLGSVSYAVVKDSPITVMIAKDPCAQ